METKFRPKITIFHCTNAFRELASLPQAEGNGFDVRAVKLACSSMIKDVYLLRAFEAGSDAVVVLACPEGQCRQVTGNLRAKKRVARVQKLLDEIGIDGKRLSLFNIAPQDEKAVAGIVRDTLSDLEGLGPNPAS
ncbi:MAG: hydrogenase iron-sulfur subunit [Dehalococcoidia bacterium]